MTIDDGNSEDGTNGSGDKWNAGDIKNVEDSGNAWNDKLILFTTMNQYFNRSFYFIWFSSYVIQCFNICSEFYLFWCNIFRKIV